MLTRVRRLELGRTAASPLVRAYGSLEAWEADCHSGMDEGRLDPRDMLVVVMAVRRWHEEGAWR
jgi:hypothetical protein